MEYLLEVQHLNKNLNTFALHDISFTLKPGFITGLIGQNGCGKTSLIIPELERLGLRDGISFRLHQSGDGY